MRTSSSLAGVLVAALAAAAGCKPDLGAPASLVVGPRILAVRGEPAEAAPGQMVSYDALAVDVGGRISDGALTWSQCHHPRPPSEANAVAAACLQDPDEAGPSTTFLTAMPAGACMEFGPIAPTQPPLSAEAIAAGQKQPPPLRPRDPDITGGFYQPVRVTLRVQAGEDIAFGSERIKCNLANVPIEATREFNATYTDNQNPRIAAVTLDPDGAATPLFAPPSPDAPPGPGVAVPIAAQAVVTLQVAWAPEAAESYPAWDVVARTLTTRREALRVSWFATAGAFAHDRTGRAEDDPEVSTRNVWTAPPTAGPVHLWVVVRDSRGGLDFAEATLDVTP